jgi:branched-chain amino acid transport system substrate-binding protein
MNRNVSRRSVLKVMAAASAVGILPLPAIAAPRTLKIGVVAPKTGPLALFTEHLDFVIQQVSKQYGGALTIGGAKHPLEIVVKDSQSNPNRASEVASELILQDKVDIVTSFGTPETANPVSDQCDLNGIPSVSTDTPVESWFFGRNGDPKVGFEWSYNFFLNVPDLVGTYLGIWDKVPGNRKKIGLLLANDNDGNAFAGLMPKLLQKDGYTVVDPGRFDLPASNYNTQISAFKAADVDGVMMSLPSPEVALFWNECAQQGFHPVFVTPGKGGEFPPGIYPFGARGENLSVEVWWDRSYPFSSSMTGQTSTQLADEFEKSSSRQASMALGYTHALFEVAISALSKAAALDDHGSVRDSLRDTKHNTVVGPIDFKNGPLPNSVNTPLVGGQWRKGSKWPLELVIVDNATSPHIPINGEVEAITYG